MTAVDAPPAVGAPRPDAAAMTTSALLLLWDQRRARSQQVEFGMSELGGCRRRAGYRLAATKPTNAGASVQAVFGTAIHDAVATVLADVAAPGDLVEAEVTFAGILGHLDRYEAATGSLVDVKTTSSRWLDHIKLHGPGQAHIWQVNGYAAALIKAGHQVRRLRIDYLARDSGEEWRWDSIPDPQAVREALAWVTTVRNTPLEMLPRDYAPDGPFCQNCPFYDVCWQGAVPDRQPESVLYVEDPDAARWAGELWDIRQEMKALKERESRVKGALDAIRPDHGGRVQAGEHLLEWRLTYPERLDLAAVKAEYAKAGAKPPYKVADKPTVTLLFASES